MRKHVLRRKRRQLAREIGRGNEELRVVGSEKVGFNLAGVFRGQVVQFGERHARQGDAVQSGLARFGQKARKLLRVAEAA